MTIHKTGIWEKMVQKALTDPDKFERMFAARYLSKYEYARSKEIIFNLLEDIDVDVVRCVHRILHEKGETF